VDPVRRLRMIIVVALVVLALLCVLVFTEENRPDE
jgi:hypothetical protein